MKKNQKFIALGLVAAMAMSTVACGNQSSGETPQPETETQTQTPAEIGRAHV